MRIPLATLVAAALLVAVPGPAVADDVYAGANVGSARVDGGDFDGEETSWKLNVGASFTDFIGGEIGYVSFDRLGGNGPDVHAWAPALTLGTRLGRARVYGKAGVAFADVEGRAFADEYSDDEPFYGVGLRFGILPGLGFRTEYERYTVGNQDIDMAQVGLELRFF